MRIPTTPRWAWECGFLWDSPFTRRPQLELFLELVPGIALFPETRGDLDGGIGIRYHFASRALSE